MSIKARIVDLAKKHSETVAEVERKLGFGNGTISKWDRRSPSTISLKAVADYYKVSTDYLLGRSEHQTEDDLNHAIDNAHSFDGKPISDKDREKVKNILRGYFKD